jgi:hypothetical protein
MDCFPQENAPGRNGTLGPFIYKGPCPCPVFAAGSFLFFPFVSRLSRFGGSDLPRCPAPQNINDLHTLDAHAEPTGSAPAFCPVHVPNRGGHIPGRQNGTSAFCPVCDGLKLESSTCGNRCQGSACSMDDSWESSLAQSCALDLAHCTGNGIGETQHETVTTDSSRYYRLWIGLLVFAFSSLCASAAIPGSHPMHSLRYWHLEQCVELGTQVHHRDRGLRPPWSGPNQRNLSFPTDASLTGQGRGSRKLILRIGKTCIQGGKIGESLARLQESRSLPVSD